MGYISLLAPVIAYAVVFVLSATKAVSKECAAVISIILIPISIAWIFLIAIFIFPIGL